jgi:HEAT repeat protein
MTVTSRRRRTFRALVAALVLLPALPAVAATPLFKLVDTSKVVLRGVVARVDRYDDDKFVVFTITPGEVLKGTITSDGPVRLAQERVFGTEAPYFANGADVLILGIPLPPYSYYRKALPAGSYLQWTDPKYTVRDVAPLSDPAVIDALRRYVAAAGDTTATARHLSTLLASAVPRLRAEALTALTSRPELAGALDAEALAPLRTVLDDERVPAAERAAMLVELARASAPGVATVAEPIAARRGPLQGAALDAMVLVGKLPGDGRLLAASRADDPSLRIAAVRGLARSGSRAAFDRIAEIVRDDKVVDVRIAAIGALATSRDPHAVGILADAMKSGDKREVLAAGESLGRIGTAEAVRALGTSLRDGSFDAEASAAFALGQTRRPDAEAILREQRELHPDPQVRRLIKLALGEHLEEHED